MKNTLQKRIPRDFKKNFTKYFGMIVILVCTICMGSAFQTTLNGAVNYLADIKENNFQEDGFFEVSNLLSDEVKEHFQAEGIWVEENFYATENEFEDSTKILLFQNRTKMDTVSLFEGQLPKTEEEILLDHVFARNRNLKVGEDIKLLGKTYRICGTASFPDYSSLFMNNTDLMMNTSHFCVSMLSKEGFEKLSREGLTYRYSYRFEKRDMRQSDKVTKAEEIQKYLLTSGYGIQAFLRADQNQSISFLEMDIGTDGPFMTVFVYLLVGIIAFIFAILTSNAIESESVIIGTLLASGFRKGEIIWHYLQPTLLVAIIGSVIGNILGYTVMIQPFMGLYYSTYSIGPLEIRFDPASFLVTTVLPVVIMFGINFLMLRSKLKLSPLKFLRKDLKRGKQKKPVKLPNWSFLTRFRLRVMIQNRGCYLMLFCGVFLSSFLLMFGIGMEPLMDHYSESINESLPYEYQYLLKAPVDTAQGEKVLVYEMTTWFSLGQKDIGITCFGIEPGGEFFGEAYVEKDIAISSALAKKMNLKEGDTLSLEDSNKEEEHSFTIGKIYDYNAGMSIFLDKEKLAALLDVDKESYNCILAGEKLDIDERFLVKRISRTDILGATRQMLESFDTGILFFNVFSVVVYMVMMFILTKVVIDKNALSISYMKVFGYEPGEIRKLFLTASTIVVLVSLVICIPLEIWLFQMTLVFLSSMIEGYMEFYLPLRVYFEIVIIGVVSYFAINAIHMRGVKKIPMTDALKNRE